MPNSPQVPDFLPEMPPLPPCSQIRRMFSAVGHEVLSLHRVSVGGLAMDGLADGEWRYLTQADIDAVFSGPTTEDILQEGASGSGQQQEGAGGSSGQQKQQVAAAEAMTAPRIPQQIPDPSPREVPDPTRASSSSQGSGVTGTAVGTVRRAAGLRPSSAAEGDEVFVREDEEEEEDGSGGLLANPASPAKKMRDDERRRRRKMALQKMVKSM